MVIDRAAAAFEVDSEQDIDQRYKECIDRISSWSVYRSHLAGETEQKLIERKDMVDGLVEMRRLVEYFDNPQNKMKIVHVAGTNGKGSVSLKIARGLEQLGFKTGLFTSPHINTFRERVSVNGILATKENIVKHSEAIFEAV